jgi:hypothetical protein
MDNDQKGKTLWEMLMERVRHQGGDGANDSGLAFENPLDLRVGSPVVVAYSNGPEFADFNFTVREIREYNRRIGGQEFRFTDYVLRGVNTKTFDADAALTVRLRAVPNQAGAHDTLLLRLYDEFAFAEDFLGVLKDTTGLIEMTDDQSGVKETFSRMNGLRESYEAAVLVVAETTPDGKGTSGSLSPLKVEYWDYSREVEIGGGHTATEFAFVEMDSDTGWFQIWRGREFFSSPS